MRNLIASSSVFLTTLYQHGIEGKNIVPNEDYESLQSLPSRIAHGNLRSLHSHFECEDFDDEDYCELIEICRWSDSRDKCVFDDDIYINGHFDCEEVDDEDFCDRIDYCRWSDSRDECVFREDGDDFIDCEDIDRKSSCRNVPYCRWSESKDECIFDCDDIESEDLCDSTNDCRWDGDECEDD